MENPEKIEIEGLKTIHKLCKFGADHNMEGCTFTEIVERMFGELAKTQEVPENNKFNLDEFLEMEQKLDSKDGVITADLDRFIAYAEMVLEKAKAQALPEGFVLVPLDVVERCMSHICLAMCHQNNSNSENDVMQMDLEILESAIESQEPK